jgi:hypothetical protein
MCRCEMNYPTVDEPNRDIADTNSKDMGNTFRLERVEPMPWRAVTLGREGFYSGALELTRTWGEER